LAALRSPVAGFIDEITGQISMAKEKVRHRAARAITENKKNIALETNMAELHLDQPMEMVGIFYLVKIMISIFQKISKYFSK